MSTAAFDIITKSKKTGTLAEMDALARKWWGSHYDLDVLHAVLAAGAAEKLGGDPLWLLTIGGSGWTKTETVCILEGAGAIVTSTLSGEAALLSGTAKKEKEAGATGGLLHRIGPRGILVIKDVTSILSMNVNNRTPMLAALREVHDGMWERNVGTGGGKTLTWRGRIVIVGACTSAWDEHHGVIAAMGDRWGIVRFASHDDATRTAHGARAIENVGHECEMRDELREAAGALLARVDTKADVRLTKPEQDRLFRAANLVTLVRTAIVCDYKGEVLDAHAAEAPTRFLKQLFMVFRGGMALGMTRHAALNLALRVARDSIPPVRLAVLKALLRQSKGQGWRVGQIRDAVDRPRNTVRRTLEALQVLGVARCIETWEQPTDPEGEPVGEKRLVPYYSTTADVEALDPIKEEPAKAWKQGTLA